MPIRQKIREILFRYQATPLSNGQSPAEQYLNRQIRIQLDAMRPINFLESPAPTQPARQFSEGERVSARYYSNNKAHWKCGKVLKKLGKLHDLVELDNGFNFRKHIDQLRSIEVPLPARKTLNFDPQPKSPMSDDRQLKKPNLGDLTEIMDPYKVLPEAEQPDLIEQEEVPVVDFQPSEQPAQPVQRESPQRERRLLAYTHDVVVVRLFASHMGEPGSISGRTTLGFSHVVIVPDEAAGRRVFSEISRFPHPCIPALIHAHLNYPPVQGGKYYDGCHTSPYNGRYGGPCASYYGFWYRVIPAEVCVHVWCGGDGPGSVGWTRGGDGAYNARNVLRRPGGQVEIAACLHHLGGPLLVAASPPVDGVHGSAARDEPARPPHQHGNARRPLPRPEPPLIPPAPPDSARSRLPLLSQVIEELVIATRVCLVVLEARATPPYSACGALYRIYCYTKLIMYFTHALDPIIAAPAMSFKTLTLEVTTCLFPQLTTPLARNFAIHPFSNSNFKKTASPETCCEIYSLVLTISKVQHLPSCDERRGH
ncbi:hypothetical protein PR048_001858 [Dryococelus australis]|uniref:Uncharacterized protein n=1 Tax=Dryococelus australis TaxID=614101 RepID=A0ABQ9IJX4_9NEOP|nr:hypothetical protein PR048_001858 [Dryococelus australis]